MGNSLAIYWWELGTFSGMAWGSIFGQGTKIPQAMGQNNQKQKQKQKMGLESIVGTQ